MRFFTKPTDAENAVRLSKLTGMFSPTECEWPREMIGASGYQTAIEDITGKMVGFAIWGPMEGRPSRFDLYWLVVDPGFQGRGIGQKLLAAAEGKAAESGCKMLVIETGSQNSSANALYKKMGYELSVVRAYYADDNDKHTWTKRL